MFSFKLGVGYINHVRARQSGISCQPCTVDTDLPLSLPTPHTRMLPIGWAWSRVWPRGSIKFMVSFSRTISMSLPCQNTHRYCEQPDLEMSYATKELGLKKTLKCTILGTSHYQRDHFLTSQNYSWADITISPIAEVACFIAQITSNWCHIVFISHLLKHTPGTCLFLTCSSISLLR